MNVSVIYLYCVTLTPSSTYQTNYSTLSFLSAAHLLLTELRIIRKDGELFHTPDLRPQYGCAIGQLGRGNDGHRLPVERKWLAGCRCEDEALSSQVRPGNIDASDEGTNNDVKNKTEVWRVQEEVRSLCFIRAVDGWSRQVGEMSSLQLSASATETNHVLVWLTQNNDSLLCFHNTSNRILCNLIRLQYISKCTFTSLLQGPTKCWESSPPS